MRCPNCHAENRDDSKFCGDCAAPLAYEAEIPPERDELCANYVRRTKDDR